MFAAFLTTILFSISAVTATRSTKLLPGTEANFWRLVVATLFLGTYAHAFSFGLRNDAFPMLFVSGCIGFGLGDLALFQALPRLGSRLTVLIVHCLAAPLAAVSEYLWMGTTLTPIELLAGIAILSGVALALAPGSQTHLDPRDYLPGVLFGLVAAFGQGFGAVLSRRAYQIAEAAGQPMDGITAAYQRIIGGVIISGIWLLFIHRSRIRSAIRRQAAGDPGRARDEFNRKRRAIPWIAVNGLAGPALGVSCFQWALKSAPTGVVLPIVAITPLVVIPFSTVMEGEKPSPRSLVGGALAVAGAVALALTV